MLNEKITKYVLDKIYVYTISHYVYRTTTNQPFVRNRVAYYRRLFVFPVWVYGIFHGLSTYFMLSFYPAGYLFYLFQVIYIRLFISGHYMRSIDEK